MSNSEKELKDQIQKLVLDSIQLDKELREKYQIGDKFRFIHDRLDALRVRIEEDLKEMAQEIEKKISRLAEDETTVYVYLFNAQGLAFPTWQKMVNPSVFYEYSVNRPLYADKTQIESFIRSRSNKAQHGYISVVIKKSDILPVPEGTEQPKDPVGSPLIKIREGSLKFNRMLSFTYQGSDYVVNEAGQLVKKQSE
ncbi:hypothetical protein AQUSIP_04000 [Aquicella siphonis]|uniref:Dot/Icm secretion system protein IcmQ n=1 Tax=Aquicella siphonis TaxID=254247 RepID=A0A5E4PE74_9COXI|nr:type IVB secretion system protein IcmQ [Aquicella siphonis]VVC75124.1 hypothetical protein AQUSIP_04000 [Aquicella siphonis]